MNLLRNQLDDPARFRRIKRSFYAALAALALAETLLPRLLPPDHAHFWFEDLPAWGSIYGFISCAAIILVSKLIGRLWLMRREDYYDS
jgi:hypothetical protein